MKSKTIVSSLLALSLALSSYGVVMADTDSGDFASDSSVFSWVYNGEGILSISPTTKSYPNPSKDWTSTYYNDVREMNITAVGSASQTPFSYSHFSTGMFKLETINVSGNCKKLSLKNYAPNIKKINLRNNKEKYVTIDMSYREQCH